MSLFVAMIILAEAELPSAAAIQANVGRQQISAVTFRDEVVSFDLGEVQINAGLIRAPIPVNELLPMLGTSPYWRSDDSLVATHQAHLIVTASGKVEKKQLALALSQATAILLKATNRSIGVYWGESSVVTQKDIFCSFTDEATIDQLPLYLWIDFRCYREGDGFALFTVGMKGLGFMEIEVPHSSLSAEDTVGMIFNVAHYLLDNGPVLKDGDTIGMSAEQKLKITHVKSAHGRDGKVYHIEM